MRTDWQTPLTILLVLARLPPELAILLRAKLASEMQKPDGLTIIPPERVTEVLERLPVKGRLAVAPEVKLTRPV